MAQALSPLVFRYVHKNSYNQALGLCNRPHVGSPRALASPPFENSPAILSRMVLDTVSERLPSDENLDLLKEGV